jgi:hypothetical protein
VTAVAGSPALLDRVATELAEVLHEPADSAAGSRFLRQLAGPATFAALLDAVRSSPAATAAVAARSYRHVLGFDKLILVSLAPLGQLRLHVWWPDQARTREHVHNHRFWFSSVVLAGSLRTYLHHLAAHGEPMTQVRETSALADRRWRFDAVGPARVATGMVADLPAGTVYRLAPDVLHHLAPAESLTATLFLETRPVRDWSSVYVPAGGSMPVAANQTGFTPAEFAERLDRLRAALAGPASDVDDRASWPARLPLPATLPGTAGR